DPLTTDASGRRKPFLNNVVPANRLNPAALAFLNKLPLPDLPGEAQNYAVAPRLRNDNDQGSLRIDHRAGQSDSLFLRLYEANFETFQPFGSSQLNESLVPGFGYNLTSRTRSVAIGDT